MLTQEQTARYLDRIGYATAPEPTLEALNELVAAHQMSVPFETVGIHRRACAPDTSLEALFEKAIVKRRGGYCFELNKLFCELLRSLGFDARGALSRAVRGREGRMPINHHGIIVRLDGQDYSVDVGFGGPMPAGALRLADDGDQLIAGETYCARPDGKGWWLIERITQAKGDLYDDEAPVRRQIELELCPAAVEDIDFDALNAFFSMPGTLFRDHEIVNLRKPNGYLGLKDDVLTIRENGQKTVLELDSPAAVDAALAERFGLEY